MRPSLRFLGLVAVGWAGVRAYTLGALPSGSLSFIAPSEARPAPAITPTEFPSIEPAPDAAQQPEAATATYASLPQQPMPVQVRPVAVPVYYGVRSVSVPLPPARPAASTAELPPSRSVNFGQIPNLDDWPLSRFASTAMAQRQSTVVLPGQSTPVLNSNRLDRLQVTAWAMVRTQPNGALGPTSLANGGNLGGSQAGARLTYAFTRQIAASFRTSSDPTRRGFEVAGGVRVQPLVSLPVWITAERRQRIGQFGGRNDFALFAEGGVYQRPLPGQFNLDAYLQAGVVGVKSRDYFIDGSAAVTRPVYKNFSVGFGVWGAAQKGIYRVDVGPRVSVKVRNNVRVHFDWRQRLAGNAQPGSGPAVTLGADF